MDKDEHLDEIKHRKALFYTEAKEAEVYDLTAEFHTPKYGLMHKTLLQLVSNYFGISSKNPPDTIESFILDIGSGTGMEALGLLKTFPKCKVVVLDLCESMHEILFNKGRNLLGPVDLYSRCQKITADIASDEANPEALLVPLRCMGNSGGYQIVVSALALHHLKNRELQEVYNRIYSVLEPGGLFLNADLFSYQSNDLSEQSQKFLLNWIDRKFTKPEPESLDSLRILGDRGDDIRLSWIAHCKNENIPIPIEPGRDVFHMETERDRIPSHIELLQRCGFREIGCPFRFWQVGILWAKK
ncbi:MAG: class I SAM-dependent methyltransferase [Candidatus Aminicenantes bacterium]|jgi:tRNA (cmo5U34)-methyltransferase